MASLLGKSTMKISVGSDRQGFSYKEALREHLISKGHEVIDEGPFDDSFPVDYPIYGEKVGQRVASGEADYGIVICATGNGIMMAANKVKGIRCGMAYSIETARLMREHNDANVVAFGEKHMTIEEVINRTDVFLNTKYLAGYHNSRVQQLSDIENGIEISQTPMMEG